MKTSCGLPYCNMVGRVIYRHFWEPDLLRKKPDLPTDVFTRRFMGLLIGQAVLRTLRAGKRINPYTVGTEAGLFLAENGVFRTKEAVR